jgi:site-specific recombinase XerD
MTIFAAGVEESDLVELMAAYSDYVAGLDCAQQAKSLRRRGALRFLERFDDLDIWTTRPTRARLEDTRRLDAWPFVSWCFAIGRLQADVDLIAARANGCHYSTWAGLHLDDVERTVAAGAQLGWGRSWIDQVCVVGLAFVCLTSGCTLGRLNEAVFEATTAALDASVSVTANHRRVMHGRLRALRQVCFQLGVHDAPPTHPNIRERSLADQLARIPQPEIRRLAQRYVETCSTTLRPSTIEDRCDTFELFAMWLYDHHRAVVGLEQLDRSMMEQFLTWNRARLSRGRRAHGQPVSIARQHGTVSALKTFFEDITLWGWAERPPRPLLHRSDLPRLATAVPRALSPAADRDLMAAVAELDDVAARCAISILRGTGIRTGELLDLELDCLADYHGHGTWLRVPVGKLNTERTVPVDDGTLAAFDEWTRHRGRSRPLEHPRTHRPVEFMWVINGRRMGTGRLRHNLELAASNAGISHVHPHQLRHTYATTLVNGGMSIEALMAVLGHVTPEMTLRYAHLASASIRDAYDAAIGKARPSARFVAGPTGQFVPDHISWLHSEMIKTRVAHGYCSRHVTAGACSYANICEQCDNYVPDSNRQDVIDAQLADVIELRNDAVQRGWTDETARHQHVADALTGHLRTIENHRPTPTAS